MATFRTKHAGRDFAFITSNAGIRVEIDGVEAFRSWADEPEFVAVTPQTIKAAFDSGAEGFELSPGTYHVEISDDGKPLALKYDGKIQATFTVRN